jgi:hypothetical protein
LTVRSHQTKKNKPIGFRLTPIFITNQTSVSNEELLEAVGLTGLIKGKVVDFYATNKGLDTVLIKKQI